MFLCSALTHLYAYTGIMQGEHNLQYIETQWFTIIFPEKSALQAAHLARYADSIYEEICSFYHITERIKMPVVLSAGSDYANAYYAGAPYNHIVIIDASSSNTAAMKDSILGTFTHELTHAITYNHVSASWSFLRRIFCNGLSLSPLTVPGFLSEGATVSMESEKENEGRLHDGFFLHTIRQAKLQETFPRYTSITGSRDTFPKDMYYSFGGPFSRYLQETYGIERYILWWYACLNTDALFSKSRWHLYTYAGYFKSVYSLSLQEAWNNFEQSIAVPPIHKNPQEEGVQEVLQADLRYAHSTWSQKGLAFSDAATGTVYFAAFDNAGTLQKPQKLFVCQNIQSLHLSRDGTFLAVGFFSKNTANYKNRTSVFDIQHKRWTKATNLPLKHAAPLLYNETYMLCGIRTESQNEFLELYTQDAQLKDSVPIPKHYSVQDICDVGNGTIAAIVKNALEWSVMICPLQKNQDGTEWRTYTVPQKNMRLRNVNAGLDSNGKTVLTFSWATTETFPRAGKIVLDGKEVKEIALEENDTSGGVYFPLLNGENLYFVGNFVYTRNFFVKQNVAFKTEPFFASKVSREENAIPTEELALLCAARPYKPFYNAKGAVVPLALLPRQDKNGTTEGSPVTLGATWVSSNLWDSDFFAISSGYSILSKTAGAALLFTGNTGFFGQNLYSYSVRPAVFINANGFKNATLDANGTYTVAAGATQTLSFSAGTFWYADSSLDISTKETARITFSTIHKTGSGFYEKRGIAFSLTYTFLWNTECFHILSPQCTLQLPGLFLQHHTQGTTYNIPLKMTLVLTPSSTELARASVQAVLFAQEIQKGLLHIPLFFNRVEASMLYSAYMEHTNASWALFDFMADFSQAARHSFRDSVQIKLAVTGTANTGLLCNSPVTLGIQAGFRPHRAENEKAWFVSFTSSTLF